VLSAKHGVLGLEDVANSYECCLHGMSELEKLDWKRVVKRFVMGKVADGFTPVFICGSDYHSDLPGEKFLPSSGIGEQMRFMRQFLNRRKGLNVLRD